MESYLNEELKKLGARMKYLRIQKGYTNLEKFAYENDIPRALYGNYENGKGNITYRNLLKIIKALGVTIDNFFSEGFH